MAAMDKAKIDELKETITLARKREMAFGICLGKKPEGTVFVTHKTKTPKVLGMTAKSDGETGHFTFGRVSVKGKDMSFVIEGKMPAGLARKLKTWLKAAGQPMKVLVLDPSGQVLDADDDEEEEDSAKDASARPETETGAPDASAANAPEAADDAPNPALVEKWEATVPKIDLTLAKFAETPGIDMAEPDALWETLQSKAADGDYQGALAGVATLTGLLKTKATDQAKSSKREQVLKAKWEQAQVKLTSLMDEVRDAGHPAARKIDAVWDLAQGKVNQEPPDYDTALKAVGMIAQHIATARKEMAAAPAPSDVGADGVSNVSAADGDNGTGDSGAPVVPPEVGATPEPVGDATSTGTPLSSEQPANTPSMDASADTPDAVAAGASTADLSGSVDEKIARIETTATAIQTGVINTYNTLVAEAVSTAPNEWTQVLTKARGVATAAKATPATADEAALDAELKALAKLDSTIRGKHAEKLGFKKALDLHDLRMVPASAHPESGNVPISTDIATIVAERTAALALSQAHNHTGATGKLGPLEALIVAVELRADKLQKFDALEALRRPLHNKYAVPATDPDATLGTMIADLNKLYTDALADKAANRFDAGIAKLEMMAEKNDELHVRFNKRRGYNAWITRHKPRLDTINAKPAAAKVPVQVSVDDANTRYTAGLIATTGDYKVSIDKFSGIWKTLDFLESELRAIERYQADLPPFETKLAEFKAHDGKDGIAEDILTMERDLEAAKSEADNKRHATAASLLGRSKGDWPAILTVAEACKTYLAKRKTVQVKVDALKGKPEAAAILKQATDLMTIAVGHSANKDFAAALASVTEAEARANNAEVAAKAQTDLAAMVDTGKLDDLKKNWDAAYKVFTDMRARVVSDDSTNSFAGLIARTDTPAAEAVKSKDGGDFDTARAYLDSAIGNLQIAQVTILFHPAYVAHLALVEGQIVALGPLNVSDKLKPQIDAIQALVDQAKALVAPEGYDDPAAESKLSEAAKLSVKAKADGALHARIRTKLTAAQAAVTAVNAAAAKIKTQLAHRIIEVNNLIKEVNDLVDAGDFTAADKKADVAVAQVQATNDDIAAVRLCFTRRKLFYEDEEVKYKGNDACKAAFAVATEKLKAFDDKMTAHDYELAGWMIYDVKFAVGSCKTALEYFAAYEPAYLATKAALDAALAARNEKIVTEVDALKVAYDEALAFAKENNYLPATKMMTRIQEPAAALLPLATGFAKFEPARVAAQAKLDEARTHTQASAIDVQLVRLTAKYDTGVAYADASDFESATTLMTEIVPAAKNAISAAATHGIIEAVNNAVGGDEDSAPWWPQVLTAKGIIKAMEIRDSGGVATTYFTAAWSEIETAENTGLDDKARKTGLLNALAAVNTADEVISQHTFVMQSITLTRAKIDTLASHAEAPYIKGDIDDMRAQLTAAETLAGTGQNYGKLSTDIESVMTLYHATVLKADQHAEYVAERAKPEMDARLSALEQHDHRYAVKPDIDTMRAKLNEAASKESEGDMVAALAALKAARISGTNAWVLAQMRDNQPPTEDEIKSILARTGGKDELDGMIDALEPEAQRAVVKVAFAARFGCNIENFTNKTPVPGNLVPDAAKAGPNIVAFYKAMSDLPDADTLLNDSMHNFSIADSGGGSFYRGSEKRVMMAEGDERFSSAYVFGSEREVGSPNDAETPEERAELEKCQPTNQDPVEFFTWNTLHEVGHAVDDKNNFMHSRNGQAAFGGWKEYGFDVAPIAKVLTKYFEYDEEYITAYMSKNKNPPIPENPTPDSCTDEEWEKRRLKVRGYLDAAFEANKPWRSMNIAKQLGINGTVYQESYVGRWFSYSLAERPKAITGYQFRAPGEWFSELYAAYHSDKLKPNHPAMSWLPNL